MGGYCCPVRNTRPALLTHLPTLAWRQQKSEEDKHEETDEEQEEERAELSEEEWSDLN